MAAKVTVEDFQCWIIHLSEYRSRPAGCGQDEPLREA